MHYIALCQNMSTRMLERGRMGHKLEFCVLPEKQIYRGPPLIWLIVIYIYIYNSLWSSVFQTALSEIHCIMIVTPNAEHIRSVRPLRQALLLIVHFINHRMGSLALWCHFPPCFVYDHCTLFLFSGRFGGKNCSKIRKPWGNVFFFKFLNFLQSFDH